MGLDRSFLLEGNISPTVFHWCLHLVPAYYCFFTFLFPPLLVIGWFCQPSSVRHGAHTRVQGGVSSLSDTGLVLL